MGRGLTDHPLFSLSLSLLGFPLLPCETANPSIRLHEARLDNHWDAGYLVEFRSCSSPLLPLHKCLQITGLTSHASHTDALSDGVAPFSAYLVGIRSGLPLAVYTLASALDLVVPGRFDFYFIFFVLSLFLPYSLYSTVVFLRRSPEMAVFVFALADTGRVIFPW